jgi:hypothetical protein
VEVGRNVGADYAVQGTVGRFGKDLTLSVEAYETMGAKLIGSYTAESETVDGLLRAMREKSPEMFAGVLRMDGVEPVKAAVAPALPAEPVPVTIAPAVGESIDPKIEPDKKESPAWAKWTAIGLDVLGAAGLVFGAYQTMNADNLHSDYKKLPQGTGQDELNSAWKKVESASTMRNVGYIAGGVLLAGGIALHIAF